MDKKVWIFQYPAEVKKKGPTLASWYVGWYDQNNKRRAESCGPGARGKNKAEKRRRRIQAQLDLGVHETPSKKMWKDFRTEYESRLLPNLAPQSREQVKAALDQFQRHCDLGRVEQITTQTIDEFIASRRQDRGKNPKSTISPATINKDLRHIKAALRVAVDWEYLPKMPKIRMVKEPQKLVRYVTPDHFAKIYNEGTLLAQLPATKGLGFEASLWWKALLATAYLTGWRIRELLALQWEDVNLDTNKIITRHQDNKGKRDEEVPVHTAVTDHLRQIAGQGRNVFPWRYDDRKLWEEFGRIQRAVGIHLVCRENHQHTDACHVYGFHDLRRAFATMNAKRLKPEVLQKMMRHKSYTTTLGYVNLAEQLEEAVSELRVPDLLMETDRIQAQRKGAANDGQSKPDQAQN